MLEKTWRDQTLNYYKKYFNLSQPIENTPAKEKTKCSLFFWHFLLTNVTFCQNYTLKKTFSSLWLFKNICNLTTIFTKWTVNNESMEVQTKWREGKGPLRTLQHVWLLSLAISCLPGSHMYSINKWHISHISQGCRHVKTFCQSPVDSGTTSRSRSDVTPTCGAASSWSRGMSWIWPAGREKEGKKRVWMIPRLMLKIRF